jgi:hypothetical protein
VPYTITIATPATQDDMPGTRRTSHTFATLEEARQVAAAAAYTWTAHGGRPDIASACQTMPDVGGTISLPDGTTLEVVRT